MNGARQRLGWRSRTRAAAFHLALLLGDVLARCRWPRPGRRPRLPAWSPGLTVIIPEIRNAELLAQCLASVAASCARVPEPVQVVVVVNGSPAADYASLRARHPDVEWMFAPQVLGFSQAIARGLRAARHDWVYLLNNDMVLEAGALVEVLACRGDQVMAVASQIFFHDPARRREETGWTDLHVRGDVVEIFDATPPASDLVRGHLYAGGGASLFRTALLRRLHDHADPYHPCYWEDAEWGVRAWRSGYEVLFCPRSRAWHRHRASVNKLFGAAEVERIFARNALLFQARNLPRVASPRQLTRRLLGMGAATIREATTARRLLGLVQARAGAAGGRPGLELLRRTRDKYYPKPYRATPERPTVVFVSPYAIFPPSHGGALRMHAVLREVTREFQVVLVSDEVEAYDARSEPWFSGLVAVHLTGGRREDDSGRDPRIGRIRSHSHPALAAEVARVVEAYAADLVQVEYIELAGLVTARAGRGGPRWALTLHALALQAPHLPQAPADRYERRLLRRFDAVVALTPEDAAAVALATVRGIPGGVDLDGWAYTPSRGRAVLFLGPLRYPRNLAGIRAFVARAWPAIAARCPDSELWILGGRGGAAIAQTDPLLAGPRIVVHDHVDDVRPFLARCALTINPQPGVRTSRSLKIADSLCAGRVCVTLAGAALGLRAAPVSSVRAVDDLDQLAAEVARLLEHDRERVAIERVPVADLGFLSWQATGQATCALYRELLGR